MHSLIIINSINIFSNYFTMTEEATFFFFNKEQVRDVEWISKIGISLAFTFFSKRKYRARIKKIIYKACIAERCFAL